MSADQGKKSRGGILGLLGLPPIALLVVAGLTLIVWWYYERTGAGLNLGETAAVVVGFAGLVAISLTLLRLVRRGLASRKATDTETPP